MPTFANTRRNAVVGVSIALSAGMSPGTRAGEYVMGYQCSIDSPEMCPDPAERKRYEVLLRERIERAAAAARAAEAARLKREREIKETMASMHVSPAREPEIRRLLEMRDAAQRATPHPVAATPPPEAAQCHQVPRKVKPFSLKLPTRAQAEADARTKVANACGVKGVATVDLKCRSGSDDVVSMKNGKVLGVRKTPYWYCTPAAVCIDTTEVCDGAKGPAAASAQ